MNINQLAQNFCSVNFENQAIKADASSKFAWLCCGSPVESDPLEAIQDRIQLQLNKGASPEFVKNVRELSLSLAIDLSKRSDGDAALRSIKGLTIRTLNLSHTSGLSDRGLDVLEDLSQLEELDISHLSDGVLESLSRATALRKLSAQSLKFTKGGSLLNLVACKSLTELDLSNNLMVPITDLSKLSSLRRLHLDHCPMVDSQEVADLRQALPECEITKEGISLLD